MLTLISHAASDLDANGCLTAYNAAASYYNGLLKSALSDLGGSLSGADVVYLAVYDIKINLMTNLSQNGNPLSSLLFSLDSDQLDNTMQVRAWLEINPS